MSEEPGVFKGAADESLKLVGVTRRKLQKLIDVKRNEIRVFLRMGLGRAAFVLAENAARFSSPNQHRD